MSLRIWAPHARVVEVVRGDDRLSCAAGPDGVWTCDELTHGDDYSLSIDGGPGRPDPRSRFQPNGVHGPSRWVAPKPSSVSRNFARPALRDAVIYEMHVGTFTETGTFEAAIARLDHLVELGVTHVELMPIAQFSGTHGWGYDGVDLFAPHAAYGGPDGLRALIDACHARSLAVIIDVVHNHFGPDGAYHDSFGPYRTSAYETPWGDAVNLDGADAAEVRRFLIDSALQWLRDYGADGLRLDAVHALRDSSERHFVAELVDEVHALERTIGRPLVLIGEYDEHDPTAVTSRRAGGWGLDAHWNDDFHHVVHAMLTGETGSYYIDFCAPDAFQKVMTDAYVLDGGLSTFRNEHHGKPFGAHTRDRLVAYTQSHDQIGNRAQGERLHHLVGPDKAKIAAALLLTSPFVPMLFQGEEWAASTPFLYFADFEDAALRDAVRAGRRREFAGWSSEPPDPIDPHTRASCVLAWDELNQPDHADMLAWYQKLLGLRRAHPALRDPRPESVTVHQTKTEIRVDRGPFTLLVNAGPEPRPSLPGDVLAASRPLHADGSLAPFSCVLVQRAA